MFIAHEKNNRDIFTLISNDGKIWKKVYEY